MPDALRIHPNDNVWVALRDLPVGVRLPDGTEVLEAIPPKHKIMASDVHAGGAIVMYGVKVGEATHQLARGTLLRVNDVRHAVSALGHREPYVWRPPDVSRWRDRTFLGYRRSDGRYGTRNLWLVVPLVFCENRNVRALQQLLGEQLGFWHFRQRPAIDLSALIRQWRLGADAETLAQVEVLSERLEASAPPPLFAGVDGVRFLTHEGGCGGTRQDAETLCYLLAGYIAHPNTAGATILSLGCQNAQVALLERILQERYSECRKPVIILEQQRSASERHFLAEAARQTFIGLTQANTCQREPAPIHHLCLGLECGGSDGFSGISANPALGYAVDLLVACGGAALLAEFPELHGVEQALINRCQHAADAERFKTLMRAYAEAARAVGSDLSHNPSPGNLRDGLLTDAMKSAGAARKGGTAPIARVLDYGEAALPSGLQLLCTPGNDVESTTALAGAGATLIAFTTGLGTPTGNPLAPTIKIASNSALARRMPDLIDFDAGPILEGHESVEACGERLLELLLCVASGEVYTCAERLEQFDFIPWKRGISL